MPNRLAEETSPYLLQHKDNPVDWFPWGDEAFEKARSEGKPVFLSVGYSSCHWCHVMEHESFEDGEIAERLNKGFVSVKVDREERPDVDEAYMVAVQLSSGRGGWPMTVFLTPDKKPFFAGTYFPKEERSGHPGFASILEQISSVWTNDRSKVLEIADQFASAIAENAGKPAPEATTDERSLLDACVRTLSLDFDEEHGGFGAAPKFPPHTAIEFLLNYAIGEFGTEELRQTAADMALFTLEKMALGGLHDQVGGGFHRYSTDQQWLVPHFEKMLYDNALLLGNYARAAALCDEQIPALESLFGRVADGVVRWLLDEMTSPEGLFCSALDADSEGEEGKFYVWKSSEIDQILGPNAESFKSTYQFRSDGNYREEATGQTTGSNIPHLLEDPGDNFDSELAKLRAVRATRVRPGLDDKAVVSWNGLAIGALAEAAELEMAERAASAVLRFEAQHGGLPHQVTKGRPQGKAFLDDYAYFIDGLIALSGVKSMFEREGARLPGRPSIEWLGEAKRLAIEMRAKFEDRIEGGFFSTSEEHEVLFGRSKPVFDQPNPSANAVAAKCMVALDERSSAVRALRSVAGWLERAPAATESHHLVLVSLLSDGVVESQIEMSPPRVHASLDRERLMAINEVGEGILRIEVPEGMHINSARPPANWLVPTSIQMEPLAFQAHFPDAPGERYEGVVEIPIEINLPAGVGVAEFELTVRFQACTETECLAPEERKLTGLVQAT
jgi:uncharacterized protein